MSILILNTIIYSLIDDIISQILDTVSPFHCGLAGDRSRIEGASLIRLGVQLFPWICTSIVLRVRVMLAVVFSIPEILLVALGGIALTNSPSTKFA